MCGQARRRAAGSAPAVFVEEARVRSFLQRLPQRISYAYLWGGEPLLHPRCEALVRLFKAQGALVELNTNGLLLEQRAESLVAARVDRLIVSIDGPAAIHDRIRGAVGAFDRLERGIAALRAARRRQAHRIAIAANVTISDDNADRLVETVDACNEIGVRSVAIRLPIWVTAEALASYEALIKEHGVARSDACRGFTDVGYHGPLPELCEQLERLRSTRGAEVDIPSWYLDARMLSRYCAARHRELWQGGRCIEARRHLNIEPDGSMVLCSDFPDLVIGTLEQPPSGMAAEDLRRALLHMRPTPCHRCCSFLPS